MRSSKPLNDRPAQSVATGVAEFLAFNAQDWRTLRAGNNHGAVSLSASASSLCSSPARLNSSRLKCRPMPRRSSSRHRLRGRPRKSANSTLATAIGHPDGVGAVAEDDARDVRPPAILAGGQEIVQRGQHDLLDLLPRRRRRVLFVVHHQTLNA